MFKENLEAAKKSRETKFGDPEITSDEQAIDILRVLQTEVVNNTPAFKKVTGAIKYLEQRLESRVSDPEKPSE